MQAQDLLAESNPGTFSLEDAYNALLKESTTTPRSQLPETQRVLVALVDRLRSNAIGSTDGWDHAGQAQIAKAAATLTAQIRKGAPASALVLPEVIAPLTPAEQAQVANYQGLLRAQDAAQKLTSAQPPDQREIDFNGPGKPTDWVQQWQQSAKSLAGMGDGRAIETDFNQATPQLWALADLLQARPQPMTFKQMEQQHQPIAAYQAGLVTSYLKILGQQHPDAMFEVGALRQGALEQQMPSGRTDGELVIAMTQADAKGQSTTQYFAVDSRALLSPTSGLNVRNAVLKNPAVAAAWNDQLQALAAHGDVPKNVVGPDAASSLRKLSPDRVPAALEYVMDAALRLPTDQQAQLFQALDAQPNSGWGPLFRPIRPVASSDLLVAADASHVALGLGLGPDDQVSTSVNVAGTPDLNKQYNFQDKNFKTLAAPVFAQYATLRTDAPRTCANSVELINELGTAMSLQPNHLPQTKQDEAMLARGQWPLYSGDQLGPILPALNQIEKVSPFPVRVASLPILLDVKPTGLVQLPLFRVETGGKTEFVDNIGRSYSSFDDWRQNNKLPDGRVAYPKGGHLTQNNGSPQFDIGNTPPVVDTPGKAITQVFNDAALVGGVVLAGAAIIGTDGLALPIAGAAISGWYAYQAASGLYDRSSHGQSLGLDDPAARDLWVNLGANVIGLGALGAGVRVGRAVDAFAFEDAAKATVWSRALGAVPTVAYGGNLALDWNQMTPQDRLSSIAQLAFWGALQGKDLAESGGVRDYFSSTAVRSQLQSSAAEASSSNFVSQSTGKRPTLKDLFKPGDEFTVDSAVDPSREGGLREGWVAERALPPKDTRFHVGSAEGSAFRGTPSATDPRQGDLGDCWLVAAMSASAGSRPEYLQSLIHDQGDHWSVSFRVKENGQWQTRSQDVPKDALVLNWEGKPAFAHGTDPTVLWPAILEYAYRDMQMSLLTPDQYARFQEATRLGGFEVLWGGKNRAGGFLSEQQSLQIMTGMEVDDYSFGGQQPPKLNGAEAQLSQDQLWDRVLTAARNGQPITVASRDGLPPAWIERQVLNNHDYSVIGVQGDSLRLRNPRGGAIITVSRDTFFKKFARMDIAHP